MSAAQQALMLDGGICYGGPPIRLKRTRTRKGDALNKYQGALPLVVADLDTLLRSRIPEKRGRQLKVYGYDRWVKSVRALAGDYYELLVNYRLSQGAQRKPKKSYIEALDCLFTNFIRNRHDGYWVRVSRNTSKRQQNGIGAKVMIELVDWLASIGHADRRLGWQGAKGNKGSGIMTSVRPVGGLLRDLRPLAGDCVGTRQACPVIVLRDGDGTDIPEDKWSRDTNEKRPRETMQRLLDPFNQQWSREVVTLDGELLEQFYFRAIFSHSFLLGGRIYEGNVQNLPQRDRMRLLIDGQRVVEADYSGCQPRIMYGMEKLTFPEDDDPYRLAGFTREAVKAAAQSLMFGSSIKASIAFLKQSQNPATKGVLNSKGKEIFKPDLVDVDVDTLADAFLAKHAGIAHLFCTEDRALKLQREDSKLMMDVLKATMADKKKRVLAYPIHDSLITTWQHKEFIVLTMRECFKKRYGFHCPVKVKG
jgi:hypothetical protein